MSKDERLNLPACECEKTDDVKPVQFRNGWGKSANGYFKKINHLCKACRNNSRGTWRYASQ